MNLVNYLFYTYKQSNYDYEKINVDDYHTNGR
jgi:hypothetical protein